jgi:hypothetical protein
MIRLGDESLSNEFDDESKGLIETLVDNSGLSGLWWAFFAGFLGAALLDHIFRSF